MLMRLYRRIVIAPARSQRYRPERHYMRGAGPASQRRSGSDMRESASPEAKAARHKERV
jgi:hypothetical protein